MQTTKRPFAVVDRHGCFTDWTRVYSAHATKEAAIKAASAPQFRASIPGNPPNQKIAMVIKSNDGFVKGEKIYAVNIRETFPVVW